MSDGAEALLQAADEYLLSLGTTLWGRSYDVLEPTSRQEAASWFLLQMMQFSSQLRKTEVGSSIDDAVRAQRVDANQEVLF